VDAVTPAAKEVPPTAVERARAFGVDVTLLLENLRLTPDERLVKAHRAAASLASLRVEAERQSETVRTSG
jgi:hypothetical protein